MHGLYISTQFYPDEYDTFAISYITVDSLARNSTAPEPKPRHTKTPTNPPPYDQIVDYGQ